jgi:hypothetical protein
MSTSGVLTIFNRRCDGEGHESTEADCHNNHPGAGFKMRDPTLIPPTEILLVNVTRLRTAPWNNFKMGNVILRYYCCLLVIKTSTDILLANSINPAGKLVR